MARFEHLFFVCTNQGKPDDPKLRCGKRDAEALLTRLQACARAWEGPGKVRVVRSGCLSMCAKGCAAVVYARVPETALAEETWYAHLQASQAEALFAAHVARGERVFPQAASGEKAP